MMRVYTYPQAKEHLAEVLDLARKEEVFIRRRKGETYSITFRKKMDKSPLDIQGIKTNATTRDILEAVRDSRER